MMEYPNCGHRVVTVLFVTVPQLLLWAAINTHTHTRQCGGRETGGYIYMHWHFDSSYLAVLNGPLYAVRVAILQSYAQGVLTNSCSAHIWGEGEREGAGDTQSVCMRFCDLVCCICMVHKRGPFTLWGPNNCCKEILRANKIRNSI